MFVYMKVCHIYLYGEIINFQSADVEYLGCVSLTTIKDAYRENPDCEEVVVHIHSIGGDLFEALAMYDFLKSLRAKGIKVTTIVEGICASAATVVFLAGEDRLLMENCRFLIHNPMSWADGTAAEIQRVASFLVDEQEKLVAFYVQHTGGDAEQLQALMDEDKFVDADTAIELKFATEVVATVQAVVKVRNRANQNLIFNSLNNKTKKAMNAKKKEKSTGIIASIESLIKKFKNSSEEEAVVENASVTTDDGTEVYFAEDALAEGIAVFSDADLTIALADGDYNYNDGDTFTVVDGKVSAITPKTENETEAETIARLTNELAAANKRADDNEALVDNLTASLEEAEGVLNKVSTSWKPTARTTKPASASAASKKEQEKNKGPKEGEKGALTNSVKEEKERRKAALAGKK